MKLLIAVAITVVAVAMVVLGGGMMYGGMSHYVIPADGILPPDKHLDREWGPEIYDSGDFEAGAVIGAIGVALLVVVVAVGRNRRRRPQESGVRSA